MLYAGVLAAGDIAGHGASLFGAGLSSGLESYLILSLAGTLGYLLGACIGWQLGRSGGRALIVSRGRWLHLSETTLARAERWFDRFGWRAVLFGRVTPWSVRSYRYRPASCQPPSARTSCSRRSAQPSGALPSPAEDGRWVVAGRASTTVSATPTTPRWRSSSRSPPSRYCIDEDLTPRPGEGWSCAARARRSVAEDRATHQLRPLADLQHALTPRARSRSTPRSPSPTQRQRWSECRPVD